MNFEEFKIELEGAVFGDRAIPDDKLLIPMTNRAMKFIAKKVQPLHLISKDITEDLLMYMDNNEYFIRKPKQITDNTSIIDIDEDLELAVVYHVAMTFGAKKKLYKDLRTEQIHVYRTGRYATLEGMAE